MCRASHLFVAVFAGWLLSTQPLLAQPALTPEQQQRRTEANELHAQVIETLRRGDFAAAIEPLKRIHAARRDILGADHWLTRDTAAGLANAERMNSLSAEQRERVAEAARRNDRIVELWRAKRFAEALPLAVENVAIRIELLGEMHPDTAQSVFNQAAQYEGLRDDPHAKTAYLRALAIREEVFGASSPNVASTLVTLAILHERQREYEDARKMYYLALSIRERAFGPMHAKVGESLNALVVHHHARREYSEALRVGQRALAVRERVHGPNHFDTAVTLNNLAIVRASLGEDDEALSLFQRASTTLEAAPDTDRSHLAVGLNGIAKIYQNRGEYAAALPLLQRALAIRESALAPDDLHTADSLDNLAVLLVSMGDVAAAQPLHERALSIRTRVLGNEHPTLVQSLHNLAMFHMRRNNYPAAISLHRRALAIQEKSLSPDHPEIAYSLQGLGVAYDRLGEAERALPLLQRALAIREKALGAEHADTASVLNALANLHRAQGRLSEAKSLYERSLTIHQQALGVNHPKSTATLYNLAGLYAELGRRGEALPMYRQAMASARRLLEVTADVQSERQQLAMAATLRWHLDGFISFLEPGELEREIDEAYGDVLTWKGAVSARQNAARLARQMNDPQLQDTLLELQTVSRKLANLVFSPPETGERDAWRREILALTTKKDALEARLSGKSESFRRDRTMRDLTAAQLRSVLPAQTALVDFLEYRHHSAPQDGGGRSRIENRLAAFVVTKDRPVKMHDLGPVATISQTVDDWRKNYGAADDSGSRLRQLVWEPLLPDLADAETVLVSPDGPLARVPLGALPGRGRDRYLLEDVAIAVIAVPSMLPDLLSDPKEEIAEAANLLVVGNVHFGNSTTSARKTSSDLVTSRGQVHDSLRAWPSLPGTAAEATAVRELFLSGRLDAASDLLEQSRATEELVRRLAPQRRFLHFATHGFFAPAEVRSALAFDSSLAPEGTRSSPDSRFGDSVIGFHPGLLSGLVLAGANERGQRAGDDGILTALEVAELDLSRVELATLSACETGLGKSAGGEGLLGLQRAFQVAGARTTVASLWQVPDQATRNLMTRYYQNLWQKRLPKLEALREAQIWMLREGTKHPDLWRGKGENVEFDASQAVAAGRPGLAPRYWAAFVLSGDWR